MEGLRCLLKPLTVTEHALKSITAISNFLFMDEKKKVSRVASYKKDPGGERPTGLQYVTLKICFNVQ